MIHHGPIRRAIRRVQMIVTLILICDWYLLRDKYFVDDYAHGRSWKDAQREAVQRERRAEP